MSWSQKHHPNERAYPRCQHTGSAAAPTQSKSSQWAEGEAPNFRDKVRRASSPHCRGQRSI